MTTTRWPTQRTGKKPTNTRCIEATILGALKNSVRTCRNEMPCFFCVVDMHALTRRLRPSCRTMFAARAMKRPAADIRAGVDPKRSPVFAQEATQEHAELAWIFNCVARLGWLDRMTQFKEKTGKHEKERANLSASTPTRC